MTTAESANESALELENLIRPEIYSKRAIYTFSFLFSTVFGGILLMQNLRDIDKKKEANVVLIVSLLITALTILLVTVFEVQNSSVTLLCNIGGAALLSEYFFKKYFPREEDYPKKKIWKPLVIGLAITIPLIYFLVSAQN
jgi:hypothetical protein